MLRAGTIRRVRQTLMATNLAQGALVAWAGAGGEAARRVRYMFEQDPFSGHVVIRSTDAAIDRQRIPPLDHAQGAAGITRWQKHCELLAETDRRDRSTASCPPSGCSRWASATSAGAGWSRAARATNWPRCIDTEIVELTDLEWRVLMALKREFEPDEICDRSLGRPRPPRPACQLGRLLRVAAEPQRPRRDRPVHHVPRTRQAAQPTGERVTKFNALFHWAVPAGPRDRSRPAGRPVPHHDPRLLARRRPGIRQRQHHGRRPRHRQSRSSSPTRPPSTPTWPTSASPSATPTSSGAAAAKSSPAKSLPQAYRDWCAAQGIDPNRCANDLPTIAVAPNSDQRALG